MLYYLTDEWKDSKEKYDDGVWLTTRALLLKLQDRGILTTWPTLNLKLLKLLKIDKIEKINSSTGSCWKPRDDDGNDKDND